jgi:hypothetical protein
MIVDEADTVPSASTSVSSNGAAFPLVATNYSTPSLPPSRPATSTSSTPANRYVVVSPDSSEPPSTLPTPTERNFDTTGGSTNQESLGVPRVCKFVF